MGTFLKYRFLGKLWWNYIDFHRQKLLWYKIIVKEQRWPRITLQHKIIFTHVPKAAGVSLRLAIMGEPPFDPQIPGHIPIRYFHEALKEDIHYYFKFTFVRHPITRLYSAFNFLKKGGWRQNDFTEDLVFSRVFLSKFDSFESFVEWLTPRRRFVYIHFYPQTFFLTDNQHKLLQDFIGKVETIKEDFERLKHLLLERGYKVAKDELPTANVTTRGQLPKLASHIIYKIYELYKEDFDLLGYSPDQIP